VSAISGAIENCFHNPDEQNLRDLDEVLRPRIYAILVSLYRRSTDYVQDAYQSAFIKYLQLFQKGKNPQIDYEAYFVAVAKNCLLDELRKQRKSVPLDELEDELVAHYGMAEQIEAGVMLFQGLSLLERRCQFLLEAHYVNSMSNSEIAKRLSIDPQSVPVLVSRCKERLLDVMRKKR
jgi:RNA polymerase sigma factor (sigma-70 family)